MNFHNYVRVRVAPSLLHEDPANLVGKALPYPNELRTGDPLRSNPSNVLFARLSLKAMAPNTRFANRSRLTTLHPFSSSSNALQVWPWNQRITSGLNTLPASCAAPAPDLSASFHNNTLVWDRDKMTILVDDVITWEQSLLRDWDVADVGTDRCDETGQASEGSHTRGVNRVAKSSTLNERLGARCLRAIRAAQTAPFESQLR